VATAQYPLFAQWENAPIYAVSSISYSPDGSLLAIGGTGSAVQLYSASTGALLTCLPTSCAVNTLAFSPDGKILADGGYGPGIELWNVATHALICRLDTFADYNVASISFSSDSRLLAVGGNTGPQVAVPIVELWNVQTHKLNSTISPGSTVVVQSVAFAPSGSSLAVGGNTGQSGSLAIWNVASGAKTLSLQTSATTLASLAFSPDGKTLADGGAAGLTAGVLELWNASTGQQIASLKTASNTGVRSVAFSRDGLTLAAGGENFNSSAYTATSVLELWDVASQDLTDTLTPPGGPVNAIAFSSDGKTLAAGSSSTSVQVTQWQYASGTQTGALSTAALPSGAVAFSPDGKTLAGGGNNQLWNTGQSTPLVLQWDVASGRLVSSFDTGSETIYSVAYSPNGKLLAVAGIEQTTYGMIQIWSLTTGKRLYSLNTAASMVYSLAFSPDGSMLVSGGNNETNGVFTPDLEEWNVATGELIRSLPTLASQQICSIALSSDGMTLAVGGCTTPPAGAPVLELWNAQTGALIKEFSTAEVGAVFSVAFSPDGKRLAVAGEYGNAQKSILQVWDVGTQKLIASPPQESAGFGPVGFTPDGAVLFANLQAFRTTDFTRIGLFGPEVTGVSPGVDGTFAISPTGRQFALGSDVGFALIAENPYYGSVPVSGVALDPPAVVGGASATATVTLKGPAPAGGEVVSLFTNALPLTEVPMFITVPAGSDHATLSVTTNPVDADTSVSIAAAAADTQVAANLTLMPPALTGLTLSSGSVIGGSASAASGNVTFSGQSAGFAVTLSSSNPSVLAVPQFLNVPRGATSVDFNLVSHLVSSNQAVTITAKYAGVTKTATITVTPLLLTGLSISPASVVGGARATGTVTLETSVAAATAVQLSSSSSSVSVPSTVVVAAGARSATFPIETKKVTAQVNVTIKALLGSASKNATLAVKP
jgi:WD40 repeat protein